MAGLGEQPDFLRALGRKLDEAQAQHVDITIHETFLAVTWEKPFSGPQQRTLQDGELAALRAEAKESRQREAPRGSLAEMLRTLGQELSQGQVEASSIVEEPEGFRVSGVAGGRYFRQLYRKAELLRTSDRRRSGRGGRKATTLSGRLAAS